VVGKIERGNLRGRKPAQRRVSEGEKDGNDKAKEKQTCPKTKVDEYQRENTTQYHGTRDLSSGGSREEREEQNKRNEKK